jgi:hypothetical protein
VRDPSGVFVAGHARQHLERGRRPGRGAQALRPA